jgi:hypothetical protein
MNIDEKLSEDASKGLLLTPTYCCYSIVDYTWIPSD